MDNLLQYKKIVKRLELINQKVLHDKKLIDSLQKENNTLKEEVKRVKKITFETNKKIEIADMANQLNAKGASQALKQKIDKYIREVDHVIDALKQLDE